ncbi:hypothetical protein B566_EDAN010561 [Ephemera danica]|nr:hypothetical protein B566_EDAN010561 [Ephemera danica]
MAPHPRQVTWCFLVITFFLYLGVVDSAHPPRRTGPCSWAIDTSLRPSGVLQTPNFPGRFQVPSHCKWILNVSNSPDSYIVIWFTQLYVLNGLKITEYVALEDSTTYDLGGQVLLDSSTHAQLLNYTWVRSMMPFLVIELQLEQLEGNHVRTRDNLLDVFGFNVTYELMPRDKEPSSFPRRCSVVECSYTGDCIADATLE